MADLNWYWHRLRAMAPGEVAAHMRRKARQFFDDRRGRDWAETPLERSGVFPTLPAREAASKPLRRVLERDCAAIRRGEWLAFGQLPIRVEDPPRWHKDYLAGVDLATSRSGFRLDHRALESGADVKLIWELSRWHQLVRLAQGGRVLRDEGSALKCIRWLEDWVMHNRPFEGWNWTSALESGMRLIQFAWVDALLADDAGRWGCEAELERLWYEVLPSHVWFTWRYKTVGSSANNHLLGELAGLIVATVRWPALSAWGPGLEALQPLWEREVLAQFAGDGGNREQALNYQLFSWELCWQVRDALRAAGRPVSAAAEERLRSALKFFVAVQVPEDPWDYGDSDNAFVSPVFLEKPVPEWCRWAEDPETSPGVGYWLSASEDPPRVKPPGPGRIRLEESGQLVERSGDWTLRWDLSPLGYGPTAAHGHLDALHLSIWRLGVALVIDPGTGAYYGDKPLRSWLASRQAHNGPCPLGVESPRRMGPFLWAGHHGRPRWSGESSGEMIGEVDLGPVRVRRKISRLAEADGWRVEDQCESGGRAVAFEVRWQFGPGSRVVSSGTGDGYRVERGRQALRVEPGSGWGGIELVTEEGAARGERFEGTVSPGFRRTLFAPFLLLRVGGGEKPCVLATTFLASTLS